MLDLFFLTSSQQKLNHIQHIFSRYDVNIRPPVDYGKPYNEPRIRDRKKLLHESVKDANIRLGRSSRDYIDVADIASEASKHQELELFGSELLSISDGLAELHQDKFFIIEDTSVIIDCLSSSEEEFPGVDVKFWMKETSFDQLDAQLKERGNDRSVTVRSDIVLYIPPKLRSESDVFYKIFTGFSHGKVVDFEHDLTTNILHPWLDNKTFNKWFVPDDESDPISALPIEVADKHDFRRNAAGLLIEYLEGFGVINERKSSEVKPIQRSLFKEENFLICGPSCAGKTVLATHLSKKYGYYHIEASDFMHLAYYKVHGVNSSINIHEFALQALENDPRIVSREVLAHIDSILEHSIVITGFRSPDEINHFRSATQSYQYFFVHANQRNRYQRNGKRSRNDNKDTFKEFKERDEIQNKMGLSLIDSDSTFTRIKNDGSLKDYFRSFEAVALLESELQSLAIKSNFDLAYSGRLTLEESIIVALLIDRKNGDVFRTTAEIAKLINEYLLDYRLRNGQPFETSRNNVSRYFNQRFYPYYVLEKRSEVNSYRLSITGISQAFHIIKRHSALHNLLND